MEIPTKLRDLLSSITILVIILNCESFTHCEASEGIVPSKSNGTYSTRPELPIIADQDFELEFQMPSEISRRILVKMLSPGTAPTRFPGKPAPVNCDRGPGTPSCTTVKNDGYLKQPGCHKYNRECYQIK
ncbi:hypothetical protein PanWU01x14_351830 [Parasponia andersonii]|uniref:Uncharacterized protein n=1 Tax=Parasponia andersonii TaxID=3476 RepID=A0A2P5AAL3_PARAD|nr:hypothetical protein PanWU01x14_351830 [Parasponia andersonii]